MIAGRNIIILFTLFQFISGRINAQTDPVVYRNLVFEGAGLRGIAYVGAVEMLDSLGVLQNIERVGGTSAGAIIALAIALRYTPDEMKEMVSKINFNKF